MSIDLSKVKFLLFAGLDSVAAAWPIAKIPAEILEQLVLYAEDHDIIQMTLTDAQRQQIAEQVSGVAAARASAITSYIAHHKGEPK